MEHWGDMLKAMVWIVFGLACLWFMKAKLGIGAGEFIKGLLQELRRIRFLKSERGGLNMAGGLFMFSIVGVYILFDSVGRLQRVADQSGTNSAVGKTILVLACLLSVGGFFLLCIRLVNSKGDG